MSAPAEASQHWDAVVIGTGMGGSTIGYELARRGQRVLFIEKGRHLQQDAATESGDLVDQGEDPQTRLRRGRWPHPLDGRSALGEMSFFAPLGCGTGGSTILYAATLERFFPSDFRPAECFPEVPEASLPEAWPVGYDELEPYYERAEALYRVHGTPDPLHPGRPNPLPAPPPLSERDEGVEALFEERGFHPYRIHVGSQFLPDCSGCGGILCIRGCKSDAGSVCLAPALAKHGAALLARTEVLRLEADGERVQRVWCERDGERFAVEGDRVFLAAGALMSPILLLRSANEHWPDGLANRSGLVGRNLMVHTGDAIAIRPRRGGSDAGFAKSLSVNDLYAAEGRKLGNLQSVGIPVSTGAVLAHLKGIVDRSPRFWAKLATPLVLRIAARIGALYFRNAVVFGSIVEDLPYPENRVRLDDESPNGMRFEYRYPDELHERNDLFRDTLSKRLGFARAIPLTRGENYNFGHPCGTCRFGDDPDAAVLDRDNRAHGVENLWVVDASFFPSSSGTNPSLTIAANALRVAEALAGEQDDPTVERRMRGGGVGFEGKTAVVTGAGSGIGRAIAIGLARDGARVVGIGRREDALRETAAACEGGMHVVVGDVSSPDDVERLFREAESSFGGVDLLVNNAAMYPKERFLEGSWERWAQTIQTNVTGMALCCRRALPGMLERGHGRIVNMGSYAWKGVIPESSAYSASKAAVAALTKGIAVEIDRERHPDVLVNELMAGVYRTAMSEDGEDPTEAYRHLRHVALQPPGGPHGVQFLGSQIDGAEGGGGLPGRLKRVAKRLLGR